MNAKQAVERMNFKDWNLSRTGQMDVESMSVQSEELFSLATNELDISFNINGDCLFYYQGERYETVEDIENRPDIVEAMRSGKIEFEERPNFEWHCNDASGEFLEYEPADMTYLPTTLSVRGNLVRMMAYWYASKVKNMTPEQRAFQETIQHFHTHQTVFSDIRAVARAKKDMERFLDENTSLMNVIDLVELESMTDSYGKHWLTLFYHSVSEEAEADIRRKFYA